MSNEKNVAKPYSKLIILSIGDSGRGTLQMECKTAREVFLVS